MSDNDGTSCTITARFTALWLRKARKTSGLTRFCIKKQRSKSFLKIGVVSRQKLPIMRLH
ncbi:MAG TPA: hypothetical protein DEF05_10915 [Erwinia sp.]|nr:hypothetical protein [Erwinia sp.]